MTTIEIEIRLPQRLSSEGRLELDRAVEDLTEALAGFNPTVKVEILTRLPVRYIDPATGEVLQTEKLP